ncbi:MAG: Flp family type IVb pilin [Parvularculaceae bacterium]|jgi:pilus assembly protein Flp/PilA|nr:Flp family type IVb pilin [Parvularculaceae bacterium]
MTTAARTFGLQRAAAELRRFSDDERGATAIEYSLIVGLIFLAIVSAVKGFTSETSSMYEEVQSELINARS